MIVAILDLSKKDWKKYARENIHIPYRKNKIKT